MISDRRGETGARNIRACREYDIVDITNYFNIHSIWFLKYSNYILYLSCDFVFFSWRFLFIVFFLKWVSISISGHSRKIPKSKTKHWREMFERLNLTIVVWQYYIIIYLIRNIIWASSIWLRYCSNRVKELIIFLYLIWVGLDMNWIDLFYGMIDK